MSRDWYRLGGDDRLVSLGPPNGPTDGLATIDAVARSCPGVDDVLVAPVDDGFVVAWCGPAGELRLPAWLDRRARVATRRVVSIPSARRDVRPEDLPLADDVALGDDPVVQLVVMVWRESLSRRTVAPDVSFFALGGHSLLAIRVVRRLESLLDASIGVRLLFDNDTAQRFAVRLRDLGLADMAARALLDLVEDRRAG